FIGGNIATFSPRPYPKTTAGLVLFDATPVRYLQFVLRLIPPTAEGLAKALREEAVAITSGKNQERLKVAGTNWAPSGALGHIPADGREPALNIFARSGQYARRSP